jgi:hypothetical protein
MIRSMEEFIFASALDFNKSYNHIKLDVYAQDLFKILFPWHLDNKNTNNYPWVSTLPGF